MKRRDWTVGEHSVRPAGKPDECFYCNRKIGEQHEETCVIRSRTVLMDFTIRLVVEVPEYWTKEEIEFRYNESSWCASNLLDMIDREEDCLCGYTNAQFIRDASISDEEAWVLVKVNELES